MLAGVEELEAEPGGPGEEDEEEDQEEPALGNELACVVCLCGCGWELLTSAAHDCGVAISLRMRSIRSMSARASVPVLVLLTSPRQMCQSEIAGSRRIGMKMMREVADCLCARRWVSRTLGSATWSWWPEIATRVRNREAWCGVRCGGGGSYLLYDTHAADGLGYVSSLIITLWPTNVQV